MASTHKLLIFAWHHAVIDLLYRGLTEFYPVVVTGETSPKARAEAVARFQDHAGTRIFVGQILAAGTAITLTAASEVAIVEPSWVPGENYQAICRAHRLGQRDSVLASFLYLPNTLDERIMAVFRRKAGEIAELQGDLEHADDDQPGPQPGYQRGTRNVRSITAADPSDAARVAAIVASGYCC
jgi:SWI/SNF-related matrix-associated actin-dependent regulator 1 of chromatin subfamily A